MKTFTDILIQMKQNQSTICPRCGKVNMQVPLHRNALSRHEECYMCSDCGMEEALRDFIGTPIERKDWFIASMLQEKYSCPGWRCPACKEEVTLTEVDEEPHFCYRCPKCRAVTGADEWEEVVHEELH